MSFSWSEAVIQICHQEPSFSHTSIKHTCNVQYCKTQHVCTANSCNYSNIHFKTSKPKEHWGKKTYESIFGGFYMHKYFYVFLLALWTWYVEKKKTVAPARDPRWNSHIGCVHSWTTPRTQPGWVGCLQWKGIKNIVFWIFWSPMKKKVVYIGTKPKFYLIMTSSCGKSDPTPIDQRSYRVS